MKKNNKFGGAIWTDHALERIRERGIPHDYAIESIKNPDSSERNDKGGLRTIKRIDDKTITTVTKKNEKGETLVISIWMDPPIIGTKDYKKKQRYNEYKKGSLGKKIWLTILKQLGI